MGDAAQRKATYEDVVAAPRHLVAEVIGGTLSLLPRPAKPHAAAAAALSDELGPPFRRRRGGPGGWIILFEPELHLGDDILVPELGGWRRQRMSVLVDDVPYFTMPPDWACEVLSPSTAKLDRSAKVPIYAEHGVAHVGWSTRCSARSRLWSSTVPRTRSAQCIATTIEPASARSMRSSWNSDRCGPTSSLAREGEPQ